jgi:hypothetical protein
VTFVLPTNDGTTEHSLIDEIKIGVCMFACATTVNEVEAAVVGSINMSSESVVGAQSR